MRRMLLLLLITHSYCMEMHETVERMVMVRRTGSDLQPAATGFIYKKENDGEEKVVEMEEREVMEHLSKLYEQPKAFAAPIPIAAGPFYAKEDDGTAPSNKEERVIPVKEKTDEVDGIADEDYGNLFKNYAGKYNHHNFDDYLHGLRNYDHGLYRKYDHKDDDDTDYKGYKINHHYGKGGADNYHSEKIESYKVSGAHSKEHDDAKSYGDDEQNDEQKAAKDSEKGHGFHEDYNKEKGYEFYGDQTYKNGFGSFTNGEHDADVSGYDKGDVYEGSDGESAERSDYTKDERDGQEESDGSSKFGAKIRDFNSKSYGFEVEH